ncbi:flagellar assembly protein FliH [Variovorax sp. OV329]|uniref:flagellar assembly protein FliH n=1 Tax=Variovorax sp. OV329 TaxID=1882825 RepID=UPI0008E4A77A|nr:flagellar assembly protein FliH [Variovorax sp. OV329]SFM65580.1 flagellar assembly protein FliH [Variovorax sp. OV329]
MTSSKQASAGTSSLAATYAAMKRSNSGSAQAATATAHAGPAESAWQRWEMQSIGTPAGRRAATGSRPAAESAPAAAPRPALTPSLDEKLLARLRIDARAIGEADGRREGLAQGHAEGLAAGRAEGLALASAHAQQLLTLSRSLPAALRRAENDLSDSLVALALDVARQVIHHSLNVEPGWIVTLVRQMLAAEHALQGEPRLLLHPEDVALVRASLGTELQEAGWQLRADDNISRGGCRVQTTGSEVDATLETRLERVTAALAGETKAAHA